MQQQQPSGFRGFVQKPLGRILLIVVSVAIVFGSYVYVSVLLAIPAILLFSLAIPIWLGIKRPRYLALSGLVVILVVAPISTAVLTQEIRAPIGAAASFTDIPGTNSTALLQNASVTPYTGSTSTNFTWTVTVVPTGIPAGNTTGRVLWLHLYISTCPGATSATSVPSWCTAGYSFFDLNSSAFPANLSGPTTVTFHHRIGSNGIWDWQMGVYTQNSTTGKPFYQTLAGDPLYNGLEGPVVGDFLTTYGELLPTVYFDDFLYLGAPFYLVLLLYMLFKNRERRRKEAAQRAAGPVPPGGGVSQPEESTALPSALRRGPPGGGAPPPMVKERTCPNCNAVVYENETTCWKCGQDLGQSPVLPP